MLVGKLNSIPAFFILSPSFDLPFSHLAPCHPQGVHASLECSTNVASVSWENSGPDQIQVVTAVNSRGSVTTCNSSSSNCTFRQLSCGESYVVSVVGHTDTCSSQPAVADMFYTGIYFLGILLLPCFLKISKYWTNWIFKEDEAFVLRLVLFL